MNQQTTRTKKHKCPKCRRYLKPTMYPDLWLCPDGCGTVNVKVNNKLLLKETTKR